MTVPEDPHKDCYVFLLAKAYQRGHGLVQRRLRPYGLTNIQYLVLEALWHREGLTAVELGQMLLIDKATLSGVLDRMVEGDWLVRERDERDRRMFRLFPSDKANGLRETLVAERKAANEELLERFTLEERVLLRRLLMDMM